MSIALRPGAVRTIFAREFIGYFSTPVAYVFLIVFLALAAALTFEVGGWFNQGQANLLPFFTFHPWLYLFMIPAIAMRLWAEERHSGTVELLLTLPISTGEAVLGKFLAAWIFAGIALGLTFPMWITVNLLGNPDNGVILAGYIGSFLMAGGYLAISSFISAATKNQVIAFVLSAAVCLLFTLGGTNFVLANIPAWVPQAVIDVIASFSFLEHFNQMKKGIIGLTDVVFFLAMMLVFLYANTLMLQLKKGE